MFQVTHLLGHHIRLLDGMYHGPRTSLVGLHHRRRRNWSVCHLDSWQLAVESEEWRRRKRPAIEAVLGESFERDFYGLKRDLVWRRMMKREGGSVWMVPESAGSQHRVSWLTAREVIRCPFSGAAMITDRPKIQPLSWRPTGSRHCCAALRWRGKPEGNMRKWL